MLGIRTILGGHGSQSTIHKYLKLWKSLAWQLAGSTLQAEPVPVKEAEVVTDGVAALQPGGSTQVTRKTNVDTLSVEQRELLEKNRILSKELISSEQENQSLKLAQAKLLSEAQVLSQQLSEIQAKHSSLEQLYRELSSERDSALKVMLEDKNQQINFLQQELKSLNQDYLEKIKTIGFRHDDTVLQVKVKLIHAEDRNKELSTKVAALEKTLNIERQISQTLRQKLAVYNSAES